jgi:hypothetical protein
MSLKAMWKSFLAKDTIGKDFGREHSQPGTAGDDERPVETDAERKRRQDDQDFTQSGFPGAM